MKKEKGTFFKKLFIVIFTITPLIFTDLFLIRDIKEENAQKNYKLEELRGNENKLEIKRVELQRLTSEDEVVKKAKDKFDLIRIDNLSKISVNKNQINNIKKYIVKKYE
jgi:hypothetical protein